MTTNAKSTPHPAVDDRRTDFPLPSRSAVELFSARFGDTAHPFYVQAEAPGRLEIIGNHTDHQGGCVISAALARHAHACAAPNGTMTVRTWLEGFPSVEIDLAQAGALAPQAAEYGASTALIRGMLAEYARSGGSIQGFDLAVCSDVPVGAGVSSSAAFEVLVGAVLRGLDESRRPVARTAAKDTAAERAQWPQELLLSDDERIELALQGAAAERTYFGKSCGAQDQLASALGGMVFMDFGPEKPQVERISAAIGASGFRMILIDSEVDHSRYPADYESVPADMIAAARFLGAERLGDLDERSFDTRAAEVKRALGQGVADRAAHFFAETARVKAQKNALEHKDWQEFLRLETASGASSETMLRNVVPTCAASDDKLARRPQRILDFCARHLAHDGAWRIHGGGFGGSILAFVPCDQAERFSAKLTGLLGYNACLPVAVSPTGARVWRGTSCEPPESGKIAWQSDSIWGTLEVSVNLRKPEKDPRAIAAAAADEAAAASMQDITAAVDAVAAANVRVVAGADAQAGAATDARGEKDACDLCREVRRFDAARELAQEPRLVNPVFVLDCETWRVHFSPYRYFPQHCIAQPDAHRPMRINRACLARLVSCVDRFPFFFMGSNADLPLVGGSILCHDHFQGGGHVFPLMRAPIERAVALRDFPAVQAGIVRWPASTLRLTCDDGQTLVDAATAVASAWERFDCPECAIVSRTDSLRHNTITPIAYRASFVGGGIDAPSKQSRDSYVIDIVLRNNRTTANRPLGVFHPDESLHHIKKENIGLIEIMGLAILPPRLLAQMPDLATSAQAQELVSQAFARILESTGVFKASEQGKRGWEQFVRSINASMLP